MLAIGGATAEAACVTDNRDQYDKLAGATGFNGGDGAASVALGDGRTLWFFGDSFTAPRLDGTRPRDDALVRNVLLLQDATGIHALPRSGNGTPAIIPTTGKGVLWPGSGIATKDAIYLIGSHNRLFSRTLFDYRQVGSELVIIDPDTLKIIGQKPLPRDHAIGWGATIHAEGSWNYIYGTAGEGKHLRVFLARAPRESLTEPWGYWDGRHFARGAASARPLPLRGFPTAFSVFRTDGRLYVLDEPPGVSKPILLREAARPWGPFGEPQRVFNPPERFPRYGYNASAHAALGGPGVTIAYSVNTSSDQDLFANPESFLPRFLSIADACVSRTAAAPR